jgi:hypothetical protein
MSAPFSHLSTFSQNELAIFFATFRHGHTNWLVDAKCPPYEEQATALLQGRSWHVLDADFLANDHQDEMLRCRSNALKVALQVYGLTPSGFDVKNNTGKTANQVFHCNLRGKTSTTFELEWACVDPEKRILAITNFDTHENFKFRQLPLSSEEKEKLLIDPRNISIMKRDRDAIDALRAKCIAANIEHKTYLARHPATQ